MGRERRMGHDDAEMQRLRDEVQRLLAAALQSNADLKQVLAQIDDVHDANVGQLETALESRDLIGQAKGLIMASLGCSADEAFALLVQQSQHENRKVHDLALELVARAKRLPPR
jgi:AmiR/NasT family two-component response regulator